MAPKRRAENDISTTSKSVRNLDSHAGGKEATAASQAGNQPGFDVASPETLSRRELKETKFKKEMKDKKDKKKLKKLKKVVRESKLRLMHKEMFHLNEKVGSYFQEVAPEEAPEEQLHNLSNRYLRRVKGLRRRYDRSHGDVAVFGSGDCGQLGCGEGMLEAPRPCAVRSLRGAEIDMVAAGGLHTLALTNSGTVFAWGCNDDGSVGAKHGPGGESIPTIVEGFLRFDHSGKLSRSDKPVIVQLAAGETQSLALTSDGDVFMWGALKDAEGRNFRTMPPPGETRAPEGNKNLAQLEQGERPEWFLPPRGNQEWPSHIYQLPLPAKDISAGGNFNAAVLADDSLVTWGVGDHGELGRPVPTLSKTTPNEIILKHFLTPAPPRWNIPVSKRRVISVSCGGFHLLVVTSGGQLHDKYDLTVFSSGLNSDGQLGHGDRTDRHQLTQIESLDGLDIAQVEGGYYHSLFLSESRKSLYACGRGDSGQLGIKPTRKLNEYFETVPVRVTFPTETKSEKKTGNSATDETDPLEIMQISAGSYHNLALTKGGDVYTWGFGEMTACGHGTSKDTVEPRKLKIDLENPQEQEHEQENKVCYVSGGGQHSAIVVSTLSKGS